ncbi:MAG TPA: serpin family protein, partial [Caulobacteraceae bacterium]
GALDVFRDSADFSGMAPLPYAGDPEATGLKIHEVVHQAWLDVDEEGAEAAAATAVIPEITVSGLYRNRPPAIFRADRPFLFVLRDKRTGLILFMGRYVAPHKG